MKKYTLADYVFTFITISLGVLIALFVDGLTGWNADRQLVANARETIRREIADNRKDLEATLSGIARDQEAMQNAIRFADDVLAKKKPQINALTIHYNVADKVSDSGWRTAERTGALSLMDYGEVQGYSRVYDFQDLFMQQQRQAVLQVALAGAVFKADFNPDDPNPRDLETFRARVMDVLALVSLQEQFGKKLLEDYAKVLER